MEYLEFLNQLLTLLMRNLLFLLFSDHQGKTEYFRFPDDFLLRSSMLFLPDIGSVSVDSDGYEADEEE